MQQHAAHALLCVHLATVVMLHVLQMTTFSPHLDKADVIKRLSSFFAEPTDSSVLLLCYSGHGGLNTGAWGLSDGTLNNFH
jgi:hypothetical protein